VGLWESWSALAIQECVLKFTARALRQIGGRALDPLRNDPNYWDRALELTNQEKGQMHTQGKDNHSDAIPAIIAIVVAVLGIAGILFEDFGSGNGSRDSAHATSITSAAVSRAGAIEIPSEPPRRLVGMLSA
jgi:hypothetical protein